MKSVNWNGPFDAAQAAEATRRRRYGVIETAGGQLKAIHFRLLPRLFSWPEWWPVGPTYHAQGEPDHCLLYYNQPRRHSKFLALKYMVSTRETSYATFRAALVALDAVARIKRSDALLCDAFNHRISERLLHRFGWEPHCAQRWHRNYIKRLYGEYPDARLPGIAPPGERASNLEFELAL